MSNMLYACSILYKTRLPFVLCFNKCDAASAALPLEWMKDYDSLHAALASDGAYMSNLTRSMSLVLQTFYETLTAVSCSAITGENVDGVIAALRNTRGEYEREYLAPLQQRMKARQEEQAQGLTRLDKDLGSSPAPDEQEGEQWSDSE
jgi:hypothetical protein